MKKLGSGGVKILKIVHLITVILMLGGIISSVTLRIQLQLNSLVEVNTIYQSLKIISDNVIRYGAQGIIVTGLIYSIWTNWGFKKYKWVAVKWLVFIGQTLFGIFFIDRLMTINLNLLASEKAIALTNPDFIHNQSLVLYGALGQITVVICLIIISVIKPWKQKNKA